MRASWAVERASRPDTSDSTRAASDSMLRAMVVCRVARLACRVEVLSAVMVTVETRLVTMDPRSSASFAGLFVSTARFFTGRPPVGLGTGTDVGGLEPAVALGFVAPVRACGWVGLGSGVSGADSGTTSIGSGGLASGVGWSTLGAWGGAAG